MDITSTDQKNLIDLNIAEMVNEFNRNGFIVINNVFNDMEISELKLAVDEILSSEPPPANSEWPLHKLEAIAKSHLLYETSKNESIVKLLRELIGENIQIQHSKIAVKHSQKKEGDVAWHQDFAFFPHTNPSLVAVSIAIMDITPENGAMLALQGGHKLGLLNHWENDIFKEECTNITSYLNDFKQTYICPKAGGISIHHCLLPHSSQINITDTSRYMAVFQYRSSDAYQLADATWKDTGIQVSGKYLGEVRFDPSFITSGSSSIKLPTSTRYTENPFGSSFNQLGEIALSELGSRTMGLVATPN